MIFWLGQRGRYGLYLSLEEHDPNNFGSPEDAPSQESGLGGGGQNPEQSTLS